MIIRDDIPIGFTYDAEGRVLTFKDSHGNWYERTYDAHGRVLTLKDSTGYWFEYTYDARGRVLTFKASDGRWRERTYNAEGLELTYKNSDGYWYEHTYDAEGRGLTYKEEGFSGTRIADDSEYVLFRDTEKDLFLAGCQGPFTRAKALKHWDRDDERAIIFTKAIREAV